MKKLLIAIMIATLLFTTSTAISEEQPQTQGISISDTVRSFMLVNNPDQCEAIAGKVNSEVDSLTKSLESHYYSYVAMGYLDNYTKEEVEEMARKSYERELAQRGNDFGCVPENSFYYYPLITIRYSKQYADSYNFNQLISDDKIWIAVNQSAGHWWKYYGIDYSAVRCTATIYDKETIEFLQNPEMIEEMVKSETKEEIVDCKIIVMNYVYNGNIDKNIATILYLKGKTTDYGIKIYSNLLSEKSTANLERYKIYTMAELTQSGGEVYNIDTEERIFNIKPAYEREALALQAEGLLQGNDRGLDLLKPLTRMEATTILVRVLGYEDEPTADTSKFTDIPNDNWGVKYANIAADKGITKGIGDNKFAPDELVTDNQFATLLLRSSGTPDFDWETAISMLIEQNIITTEQADTMDLFTRGDMAKIIYEAREKGLIN